MEKIFNKLSKVQKELKEKKIAHWLLRFEEEHLQKLSSQIKGFYENPLFLEQFKLPVFSEEIEVNREKIFEQFVVLASENELEKLVKEIQSVALEDALVVLGQRITQATVQNEQGIPPLDTLVYEESFRSYNTQISKAVRAFEKHAERYQNTFWGKISGNPRKKEKKVKEYVTEFLKAKTWWNVYYHYKHELVYEVRIASGHGARWKVSSLEFIGFVEPFLDEE